MSCGWFIEPVGLDAVVLKPGLIASSQVAEPCALSEGVR